MTEFAVRRRGNVLVPVDKSCEHCGQSFGRPKDYSHAQWSDKRFCSRECARHTTRRHSDPRCRFERHFVPEPMSGCWLWDGTSGRDGYGQIRINGDVYLAHRLSWVLHVGTIPDGMCVLHRCDTPPCVNPRHLFLGSNRDNTADKVAKGRQLRGDGQSQAKLSAEIVRLIRSGPRPDAEWARMLGTSRPCIRHARTGHTWGWVQ